mmetsp:Transcript_39555/g.60433  ORF Transcript_39555/g.60433 Transcript_39555/m.60433 type:complete len:87 (-) Transcript_39555:1532-1792(-)
MGQSSLLGLKDINLAKQAPLDDASCIDDAMEILLSSDMDTGKADTEMYAYSQELLGQAAEVQDEEEPVQAEEKDQLDEEPLGEEVD